MKKMLVYFDEERYNDLKEFAHRNRTTVAALVRHAIEETFEDDLDAIRGERRLQEAANDPDGYVSWEELKAELRARREGSVRTPG